MEKFNIYKFVSWVEMEERAYALVDGTIDGDGDGIYDR